MADEYGVPQPGNAEDYQQFMLALHDVLAHGGDIEARQDALAVAALGLDLHLKPEVRTRRLPMVNFRTSGFLLKRADGTGGRTNSGCNDRAAAISS
jgi:hypothetical protein